MTTINTATLNVNDIVYASFGRYGEVDVRKGVIIKKSATGVVKVRFVGSEHSYLQCGRERGGGWSSSNLIDEATYQRLLNASNIQHAARRANNAIKAVGGVYVDGTNRNDVIARLEAALAAVRAVPGEEG